jgi:ferredoxin
VQVSVDENQCQGHARCHLICPEVFDLDDAGYVLLPSPEVPEEHEQAVQEAVLSCPEGALSIVE